MNSVFSVLAQKILFAGLVLQASQPPEGFDYRSKKTVDDLRKAIHRGIKNGRGKTEWEIDAVAVQLQSVLKVKR